MRKAKRLVFPGKMQVEIEEFELPEAPGPGEILVENCYGLISPGTELAMFTETHVGFPLPEFGYAKFPFRPGYAAVGRVLQVGEGVKGVQEGDMVFTRAEHASHAIVSGEHPVLKAPGRLPAEHMPFVALANIALTSVRLSEVRLGHTVAVFGQGLIGNLAAQLMRCAGARKVIGIDTVPERLAISTQCGIDVLVNPAEDNLRSRVDDLTDGAGCQIVVEATGNPQVAPEAIRIAAQMGKVVLLGSPRGSAEIDLYFDLHRTGVSLIGAHGSRQADATQYGDPDPNALMLEFIADGRLQVAPLLTHTLPVSAADRAYRGLLDEKENYLGVLLDLRQWG
ncbi:MAG: zinc-binding alcohol dehydrogenase [Candidatus Poribacteria bacterium]|nr:zinc-binding alcohol dehydrogenase [Candidatus Poribacteria bacterium]